MPLSRFWQSIAMVIPVRHCLIPCQSYPSLVRVFFSGCPILCARAGDLVQRKTLNFIVHVYDVFILGFCLFLSYIKNCK